MNKKLVATATLLGLATLPNAGHAAGFALIENSASGMGNAFAGAGSLSDDASAAWFNPAAISRFKRVELTAGLHLIKPTADFTDKGSYINPALTAGVTPGSLSGPNDGTATLGVVPNFYYVHPVNSSFTYGLTLNAPFGLSSEYGSDWVGRYHATSSALSTINIGQVFSWRLDRDISFGFSVDMQYAHAELSSAIDSGALCLKMATAAGDNAALAQCLASGLTPNVQANDSSTTISGDDVSFGYGLGMLYDLSDKTRMGMTYRAAIEHNLNGEAIFSVNPALRGILDSMGMTTLLGKEPVSAVASLPATASISFSHLASPSLTLLADVTWTGWSSFKELRVKFDSGNEALTEEKWQDNLRYSLGLNYRSSPSLTWRTGVAFDETPIPDEQHRTPRIPGNSRTWLAAGIGFQANNSVSYDIGFAHLFIDQSAMDHTDENGYALRGLYDSTVNILSAQVNWKF